MKTIVDWGEADVQAIVPDVAKPVSQSQCTEPNQ